MPAGRKPLSRSSSHSWPRMPLPSATLSPGFNLATRTGMQDAFQRWPFAASCGDRAASNRGVRHTLSRRRRVVNRFRFQSIAVGYRIRFLSFFSRRFDAGCRFRWQLHPHAQRLPARPPVRSHNSRYRGLFVNASAASGHSQRQGLSTWPRRSTARTLTDRRTGERVLRSDKRELAGGER